MLYQELECNYQHACIQDIQNYPFSLARVCSCFFSARQGEIIPNRIASRVNSAELAAPSFCLTLV